MDNEEMVMDNELTEEELTAIQNTSLEDLLEDLSGVEDTVDNLNEEELTPEEVNPALESLMSIVDDIRASGAISRSDAATLSSMTASLEGYQDTFNNLPLGSFTEVPSKVNFDVSMENIAVRTGKAIIEVIKKVIAWIRDKFKQLRRYLRDKFGRSAKVEQVAVAMQKANVDTTAAEVVAIVAAKKDVSDAPKPKTMSVAEAKETKARVIIKTMDDLDRFMLGDDSGEKFMEGLDKLKANNRILTKALEKIAKDNVDKAKEKAVAELRAIDFFILGKDGASTRSLAFIDEMLDAADEALRGLDKDTDPTGTWNTYRQNCLNAWSGVARYMDLSPPKGTIEKLQPGGTVKDLRRNSGAYGTAIEETELQYRDMASKSLTTTMSADQMLKAATARNLVKPKAYTMLRKDIDASLGPIEKLADRLMGQIRSSQDSDDLATLRLRAEMAKEIMEDFSHLDQFISIVESSIIRIAGAVKECKIN